MEQVLNALRTAFNRVRNDPMRQMLLLFDFFGMMLLIISIVDHNGTFNADENTILFAGFGIGTGNGIYLSIEMKRAEQKLAEQKRIEDEKNASDSSAFDKK